VANADDLMHLGDALRVILTAMMVMEQSNARCNRIQLLLVLFVGTI
jgi:hypothetical protein